MISGTSEQERLLDKSWRADFSDRYFHGRKPEGKCVVLEISRTLGDSFASGGAPVLANSGTPRLGCRTALVITKSASNIEPARRQFYCPGTDTHSSHFTRIFYILNTFYILVLAATSLNLNFIHLNKVIFTPQSQRYFAEDVYWHCAFSFHFQPVVIITFSLRALVELRTK